MERNKMVCFAGLVAVLIAVAAVGIGSDFLLGHDNPIEEASEQVIFNKTGVDIDFSPGKDPSQN